jgi:hypothetical protein
MLWNLNRQRQSVAAKSDMLGVGRGSSSEASPQRRRRAPFDASPRELYGEREVAAAGRREADMDSAFRRRRLGDKVRDDALGEAAAAALELELQTVHGRLLHDSSPIRAVPRF